MRIVELTQGYVALVDDADFARVSAHKWCANKNRKRAPSMHIENTRSPQAAHSVPAPLSSAKSLSER